MSFEDVVFQNNALVKQKQQTERITIDSQNKVSKLNFRL